MRVPTVAYLGTTHLGMLDMHDAWLLHIHGEYAAVCKISVRRSRAVCHSVYAGEYPLDIIHMFSLRTNSASKVNVCNDKNDYDDHILPSHGCDDVPGFLPVTNTGEGLSFNLSYFIAVLRIVLVHIELHSLRS